MQETLVRSLGGKDPLEKEMATHSSILTWRIPQTREPDGLWSMGPQSQTQLSTHASILIVEPDFLYLVYCKHLRLFNNPK